jgi:hypothetical protein
MLLADRLRALLHHWRAVGLPSRDVLLNMADEVAEWKRGKGLCGLWTQRPLLLTATLDDGWGFGLQIIERWAEVAGLQTQFLGLLQKPEVVIEACHNYGADLVGLTVLQFDSEAALAEIRRAIPTRIKIIAGGAALKYDPEMAKRTAIDCPAKDVADFLQFLLETDLATGRV